MLSSASPSRSCSSSNLKQLSPLFLSNQPKKKYSYSSNLLIGPEIISSNNRLEKISPLYWIHSPFPQVSCPPRKTPASKYLCNHNQISLLSLMTCHLFPGYSMTRVTLPLRLQTTNIISSQSANQETTRGLLKALHLAKITCRKHIPKWGSTVFKFYINFIFIFFQFYFYLNIYLIFILFKLKIIDKGGRRN